MGDRVKLLKCPAQTHMILSPSKRYLFKRCSDVHCPDAAHARDVGKIALHRFDMRTPDVYMSTLFFDSEADLRAYTAVS